jgi:Ca-activated chloride channel family protein
VSAEEKKAAGVFAEYLADAVDAEMAGRYGFRPADPAEPPAGAVTAANGVDPREPDRVLSLPEPRVLARIKEVRRADRKPANVMMVFDNSESMGHENKLAQALKGLKGFFREAAPQDYVGLIKFSSEITELVPIGPMRTNRAKLLAAADRIVPEGETRVRDATLAGLEAVLVKSDPDAINAVVVLTDGQDTRSNTAGYDVIQRLAQEGRKESGGQVRVFTIAYGREPNAQELAKYADVTGGKSYTGTTSQIGSVYREISSFF